MPVYGLQYLEWNSLLMLGLENKMLSMMNSQGRGVNISSTKTLLTLGTSPVSYWYLLLYYRDAVQAS